jgi:flagellar operon protein
MNMNIQNSPYLSAAVMPKTQTNNSVQTQKDGQDASFSDFLIKAEQDDSQEIKFSRHAQNRLAERNISLTDAQLNRLQEGTEKAGGKGLQEPLVLIDNLAFIVSTKNNTVITAMESSGTQENIFTNIDGAVIN